MLACGKANTKGVDLVDVDDVVVVAVESPADEGDSQSACSSAVVQGERRAGRKAATPEGRSRPGQTRADQRYVPDVRKP